MSWLVPVCPVKASGWAGKVPVTFPCIGFTTTSQAKGTGEPQLQVTAEPPHIMDVTETFP